MSGAASEEGLLGMEPSQAEERGDCEAGREEGRKISVSVTAMTTTVEFPC